MAPSMCIASLFADLICVWTGISALLGRFSFSSRYVPLKHDIHPVSAVVLISLECLGWDLTVFSG